ncbi:molybdenum cofactor guanylyltransferase MobA [Zobellella denitrificans]|jgi:molybdopterin-guanine dinucleotide biosynthesis protein A|uniref:Molybdenum cofactor guanylyltransferase n=1 Tax=Zobellella denitrificans TaxID=347534 RepID=A0A231MUL3_9GAMM|nr:molybdenum cofactor guanylyltransferase MobA [Zobellella denitrificans]ATG74254.1 molybdopterin-guanine dinucleotide biosynthesis protein A [Zobellella denitrificans]OXS13907.1 molybdenum cofactor guanylyltransferase MobA [Zobellella denitrificans]
MLDPKEITAVILAGGEGRRMNGADKGLLPLWGKPLVCHVLERLKPQVGEVLINANRNLAEYRKLAPVVRDEGYGYVGPLAGFEAGLTHAPSEWVLFVPCDSPLVPLDLARRLCTAVQRHDQIAVVDDGLQLHAATALLHQSLLPSLCNYLDGGDRKLQLWYERHQLVPVDFSDEAEAFFNLNTSEALALLEQKGRG